MTSKGGLAGSRYDVLLRLSTIFLESRETRTSERARSISIDVTIDARGIVTFFEETPFEKGGQDCQSIT